MTIAPVKITELCEVVAGGTPDTGDSRFWGGNICWATPKDLSDLQNPEIFDTSRKLTSAGLDNSSASVLPPGSVLFSSRAPIGLVAINRVPMATNQGFKSFIPRSNKIDSSYLYYWLLANRPRLQALGNGATFKEVSKSVVERIEIPVPWPSDSQRSLAEQKRIAAILDKADALRRKRREALVACHQLARSIFRSELGNPHTNPHGWPILRLGEVINFVGGSQPPKETFLSEPRDGYIRLVQIRDFKTDAYPTYIPRASARRFFEVDDVMIARYGPPVFQILRGLAGSYNVALMKAEPSNLTIKGFIFHLLQIPEIHDVVVANSARTAGQSGVNLDLLERLQIPIPPVHVQRRITNLVERVEATTSKIEEFIVHTESIFSALVHRAFRGEL